MYIELLINYKKASFFLVFQFLFVGLAVNGQNFINAVEANSSPSHIIATQGSSVWLHWNYTYIGDGTHYGGGLTTLYGEQRIELNSTSETAIKTLARRTGQNGALTLELPVPLSFNGRVEVISANSTLVIHKIQYNDSTYHFSSSVSVVLTPSGGDAANSNFVLKPAVLITVTGMSIYHFPLFFTSL